MINICHSNLTSRWGILYDGPQFPGLHMFWAEIPIGSLHSTFCPIQSLFFVSVGPSRLKVATYTVGSEFQHDNDIEHDIDVFLEKYWTWELKACSKMIWSLLVGLKRRNRDWRNLFLILVFEYNTCQFGTKKYLIFASQPLPHQRSRWSHAIGFDCLYPVPEARAPARQQDLRGSVTKWTTYLFLMALAGNVWIIYTGSSFSDQPHSSRRTSSVTNSPSTFKSFSSKSDLRSSHSSRNASSQGHWNLIG